MATWTGIHRIRGNGDEKNRVQISDGEVTHEEMTEKDYRSANFQPPFDDLPWGNDMSAGASTPTPAQR